MLKHQKITDDLDLLLDILPPHIADTLRELDDSDNLLEVVMDLGRLPKARFVQREATLSDQEVTYEDLHAITQAISDFDADNRAGIERTLHRISAIRNRHGEVIGLTLRIGRAVYGTSDIIQDLIESGSSILILGRPGVGKTTILREAARILAESARVIIVDTSNEIGGDGDVPHPAIGAARRMQVAKPSLQHEVMIEAVENHNPEVIVIDEIGRELEAQAARTIAERGVQLIGTAHGNTLENLLLNPTLSDLVGGIESVTLSDEEARRGTQKTVLERRAPATFDVLVEIQERNRIAVQSDVSAAVDALLRGYPLPPEIRYRDDENKIHTQKPSAPALSTATQAIHRNSQRDTAPFSRSSGSQRQKTDSSRMETLEESMAMVQQERQSLKPVDIYPYGVARNRLLQAAKQLQVPAKIARNLNEADALLTLRRYYRERQQPVKEAEERGLPIFVLRSNTSQQMEQFLVDLFNLSSVPSQPKPEEHAVVDQTQAAIQAVLNGERWVDLDPASATIRRLQHEMARQADLVSHSYGKEPQRHVRIFRD